MKYSKTASEWTGTISAYKKTCFICTMLRGEALREFDVLAGQVGSMTNGHLKLIKEGLLRYFPPINALTKQECVMRHAMKKPRDVLFKRFSAQMKELNNYLPLFPVPSAAKKMDPEELNKILLHAVPNSWAKKSYIQGWDFEGSSYKDS